MNIHQIRKYFVETHIKHGYNPSENIIISIPKHIRYILTKQVLSLNPSDDMINIVFKEVIKLYFESLPEVVKTAYRFDDSRNAFEISVKSTIKQFWTNKHIEVSDEYYKIYDIVCIVAEPMKIWKKQFYLEQLPHYIEGRDNVESIIEAMFEDHVPPIYHMWDIENIIRDTLKKIESLNLPTHIIR
jgi:hypothetical protein